MQGSISPAQPISANLIRSLPKSAAQQSATWQTTGRQLPLWDPPPQSTNSQDSQSFLAGLPGSRAEPPEPIRAMQNRAFVSVVAVVTPVCKCPGARLNALHQQYIAKKIPLSPLAKNSTVVLVFSKLSRDVFRSFLEAFWKLFERYSGERERGRQTGQGRQRGRGGGGRKREPERALNCVQSGGGREDGQVWVGGCQVASGGAQTQREFGEGWLAWLRRDDCTTVVEWREQSLDCMHWQRRFWLFLTWLTRTDSAGGLVVVEVCAPVPCQWTLRLSVV